MSGAQLGASRDGLYLGCGEASWHDHDTAQNPETPGMWEIQVMQQHISVFISSSSRSSPQSPADILKFWQCFGNVAQILTTDDRVNRMLDSNSGYTEFTWSLIQVLVQIGSSPQTLAWSQNLLVLHGHDSRHVS